MSKRSHSFLQQDIAIDTARYNACIVRMHALPDPAKYACCIVNLQASPEDEADILYHFNPRFARGLIWHNARFDKNWGPELTSRCIVEQAKDFELMITWSKIGFEVFVNDEPCVLFRHQGPLPPILHVVCPEVNGYGDPVYRVVHSIMPMRYIKPHVGSEHYPRKVATAERTLMIKVLKDEDWITEDVLFEKMVHYGIDTEGNKLCFMKKDGMYFVRLLFNCNVKRATDWLHGKGLIVQRTKESAVKF